MHSYHISYNLEIFSDLHSLLALGQQPQLNNFVDIFFNKFDLDYRLEIFKKKLKFQILHFNLPVDILFVDNLCFTKSSRQGEALNFFKNLYFKAAIKVKVLKNKHQTFKL